MTEVRAASSSSEVDEALELRRRVFVDEQKVALDADRDGRDPEAIHVVALETGHIVGTCRLVFDDDLARLGRMAVEHESRGRGIGAAMLGQAEAEARAAGATRMRLHAQTAARTLYERAGFEITGEEFIEEGIPHVTMEKPLA